MRDDLIEERAAETLVAIDPADFLALPLRPAPDLVLLTLLFALVELVLGPGQA